MSNLHTSRNVIALAKTLPVLALLFAAGTAYSAPDTLRLALERAVFLKCEGVYNLSGITLSVDGWAYVVDDHGPAPPAWEEENPIVLKARLADILDSAKVSVPLERAETGGVLFDYRITAGHTGKIHKYDLEGVTFAGKNRLWAVDERDRLLLELDLASGAIASLAGPETLLAGQADLLEDGVNTALEGVALLGKRLFIAWEMHPSTILVYRLGPGRPVFEKRITVDNSLDLDDLYTDKSWLYALGRTNSEVYKIDPESGKTLLVANFKLYADSSAYRYQNRDNFYNSEGLALTDRHILVLLDGNMQTLLNSLQRAPLLLVFKRPDSF